MIEIDRHPSPLSAVTRIDSRRNYCQIACSARSPSPRLSPACSARISTDLGVRLGPDGGTLRAWSENAESMELVVFDDTDLDWIVETIPMAASTAGVWTVTTPRLAPGARYAVRVAGPQGPCNYLQPAHAPHRAVLAGLAGAGFED